MVSGSAFLGLLALNRSGATQAIDREMFVALRDIHAPWFDVLGTIDDIAFRPLPTFAIAIAMSVVLAWKGPQRAWILPLGIGFTAVLEFLSKRSFSRGVHFGELIVALQGLVTGHFSGSASFPSGHVARATFLAVIAWWILPRVLAIPLAIAAGMTLFARMYTESHRLSDVLGGAALGVCVGSAMIWIASSRRSRTAV